jgi:N12 class adenine-specific DNA methylase
LQILQRRLASSPAAIHRSLERRRKRMEERLRDPGAGKTVMAGLLIKELLIRGDLERCLIVAPGSLVEQWQEEMAEKFWSRL